MGVLTMCDKCKNGVQVRLYGLRRYSKLGNGELSSNSANPYQGKFESAGSIYLCDACWTLICKPHMKPQRRPRTLHNQHTEAVPNPRRAGADERHARALRERYDG